MVKSYPKIKFELNKLLDKKVCNSFLFQKGGGINFGTGIVKDHPKLSLVRKIKETEKRKKLISDYIDSFYKNHSFQLKNSVQRFNRVWKRKEKEFFNSADKIFKVYPWPEGGYIGYLSIFNCNPRNLKEKTFQVYYQHPAGAIYVASHELLHFIFYDYFEKKFKGDLEKISKEKLWEVSEVFNSVLFSFKPLSDFSSKQKEKFDYPAFKSEVEKGKKIWERKPDIDYLLKQILPR